MSVALNSLSSQQSRTHWTLAMRDSGKTLSWDVGHRFWTSIQLAGLVTVFHLF